MQNCFLCPFWNPSIRGCIIRQWYAPCFEDFISVLFCVCLCLRFLLRARMCARVFMSMSVFGARVCARMCMCMCICVCMWARLYSWACAVCAACKPWWFCLTFACFNFYIDPSLPPETETKFIIYDENTTHTYMSMVSLGQPHALCFNWRSTLLRLSLVTVISLVVIVLPASIKIVRWVNRRHAEADAVLGVANRERDFGL